jgi:hypothetical protein
MDIKDPVFTPKPILTGEKYEKDCRPKTIFLDIDGCLLIHSGTLTGIWDAAQDKINSRDTFYSHFARENVKKLSEWERKGHTIILVTGRKECMREDTENQLRECGIFYDRLIMGITGGQRVIINDMKPTGEPTALAFNLERNQGLENVEI